MSDKNKGEINMGIFGEGYLKEGKGVDKNEPKKKGFFLFFDILIHKISKLVGVNCLYTMTSIVWVFILYMFFAYIVGSTGIVETLAQRLSSSTEGINVDEIKGSIAILLQLTGTVTVFTLWGSGPASAAYAYINRCFTRGEHVWVVSDGMDKIKENFKQGMIVVLFDAVILIFAANALYFYHVLYANTGQTIWFTLSCVVAVILILYTMIHPYIYQIMITFECGIWSIYKNALLVMMAKLPVNLLLTAISVCIIYGLFTWLNPLVASLIAVIVGMCVITYPPQFYAARVIEKSILKDMREKKPEIEYIGEDE